MKWKDWEFLLLSQLAKKSKGGLIQGISSKFDTQLCTQNHLQQTYALASIIGQPSRDDDKMKREDVQRLKKQQLYKIQLSDIEIKTFADEKKPKMPALLGKSGAFPFKVLCHKIIIQRRASQENFLFLKSSVINPSTPDFSGYNQGNWSEFKRKMKFILPSPD